LAIANGDERTDGFPQDVFDALGQNGLFGVGFSSDVGGQGLKHPATATAATIEELAYHSSSIAAIFDVHCILSGNALNQGTDDQRQRWRSKIVSGDIIGGFATTEPRASSDLSLDALETVATETLAVPPGFSMVASGGSRTRRLPARSSCSPALATGCRCSSWIPTSPESTWGSRIERWVTGAAHR